MIWRVNPQYKPASRLQPLTEQGNAPDLISSRKMLELPANRLTAHFGGGYSLDSFGGGCTLQSNHLHLGDLASTGHDYFAARLCHQPSLGMTSTGAAQTALGAQHSFLKSARCNTLLCSNLVRVSLGLTRCRGRVVKV